VTDWQPELTLYQLLAPTANTGLNNTDNTSNTNAGDGSNSQSDQGTTNNGPPSKQVPVKSDATRVAPAFDPAKVKPPCGWPNCI
jgi:hypothetical protein